MAEIADSDLETLGKSQALLNALLADPKHGLAIERVIKEKFPTANTQRLDQMNTVFAAAKPLLDAQAQALTNVQNELAALRASTETKDAENQMRSNLDKIQKTYGLTDDGMAGVIETAKTRNLAHDLEAAADVYLAKQPKPKPTSRSTSYFPDQVDIYGMQSDKLDEKWEILRTQPNKFFEQEIMSVMDEFANVA